MSQQQATRPNAIRIFLSNEIQLAISKLCAEKDIPSLNASLYAINEGLKDYLPKEVYEAQRKRYSRTLAELQAEKEKKKKKKEELKHKREERKKEEIELQKTSLGLRLQQRKDNLEDEISDLREWNFGTEKEIKDLKDFVRFNKNHRLYDETKKMLKKAIKRRETIKKEITKKEAELEGIIKRIDDLR